MNAKEILKLLKQNGFYELRQSGSHKIMTNGTRKATVPVHGKVDVKVGTIKNIEKQSGVKLWNI